MIKHANSHSHRISLPFCFETRLFRPCYHKTTPARQMKRVADLFGTLQAAGLKAEPVSSLEAVYRPPSRSCPAEQCAGRTPGLHQWLKSLFSVSASWVFPWQDISSPRAATRSPCTTGPRPRPNNGPRSSSGKTAATPKAAAEGQDFVMCLRRQRQRPARHHDRRRWRFCRHEERRHLRRPHHGLGRGRPRARRRRHQGRLQIRRRAGIGRTGRRGKRRADGDVRRQPRTPMPAPSR